MAPKAKAPTDRSLRMNWGGCSPHPDEDRDVFLKLPAWRQAEMLETREIVNKYPYAQTFRIINIKTGKPYPGQVLFSEIQDALLKQRSSLPEVPNGYKFSVPDGVPRGVFVYGSGIPPTEEQAHGILLKLEAHLTQDRMEAACLHERRLLTAKPLDGVYAFVWRLARYLSGEDASIPSTAFVDLIDGVSGLVHLRVDPWQVKTIMKFLEDKAASLVASTGGNRHAGSLRWAQTSGAAR